MGLRLGHKSTTRREEKVHAEGIRPTAGLGGGVDARGIEDWRMRFEDLLNLRVCVGAC